MEPSQTGWSGQNAQAGTAYNSGATATYTLQSALSGKRYFIRAYAIDPAGAGVWGSASATRSFLTTNVTPGPCTSQPGGDINIDENCNFTGGFEGADAGNLAIKAGSSMTVNANQNLVWNPGQSITIEPGAQIIVNSSAKLTQSYMFTPSSGSSGYPDPIGFAGAVATYHMDDACGCTTSGCTTNTVCTGGKIFNSTGSNDGTATGTTIVDGKFGKARSFNGTSDYVSLPVTQATLPLTIAMWVKPVSATPVGMFDSAPSQTNVLRNYPAGYVEWWNATPRVSLNLSADTWQHIAFVFRYDGTNRIMDYYKNGVLQTTASAAGSSTFAWTAFTLGNINGGSAGWYSGTIDEVQIFNRALSAMEIQGLYNPPSSGMQFMYQSTNPDASAYRRRKDIYSAARPMAEWKMDEQSGALVNTAP